MTVVRLFLALPLAVGLLAVPAAPALAETNDICEAAQADLALIDEAALAESGIIVRDESLGDFGDKLDFQLFVLSKSGVDPETGEILTTSFDEFDPASPGVVKQIRCKLRTGESLDQGAWPEGSANNSEGFERPPFFGFGDRAAGLSGGRGTCQSVNDQIVASVWDALSPVQRQASAFNPDDGTLVTVPDEEARFGPVWTTPFEPTAIENGVLKVRSKSLYAPTTDTSGIGPRFLGAHYCTLVGPDYLAGIIAANSAPIPSPTPTAPPTTAPPTTVAPTAAPTTPVSSEAPVTTSGAASDDTAAASGATLPATGSPILATTLLGALVAALGALLVGRERTRVFMAAGPGRHRARRH